MIKKILAGTVALVAVLSMSGCAKAMEPWQDADRAGTNDSPADTITFPDGFNNLATKCDHGNRVYSTYHADSAYGAVAVVPHDPSCQGR